MEPPEYVIRAMPDGKPVTIPDLVGTGFFLALLVEAKALF
jgi:hypothetical protein